MLIEQKHCEEVRRNTFSATSRYDRERRLAAVRHCLTRVHLLQRFNNLVRYYLTRIFLLQSFNRLVRYYLTSYFLLKVLTTLSGTT